MSNKRGIQQQLSQNSTLQKYRSTVIGNNGIIKLLLYEFSITVLSPLPGPIGIQLRQLFFPFLFNHFGHKNVFKRDVTFRRPNQITIGKGVILERGVTLDVKSDGGCIDIQDDVRIGRNTILSCPGGSMVIGEGTHIGENCRLGSLKGLKIGKYATIAEDSCIVGAGHAYNSRDIPITEQELTCKGPTLIEDYVEIAKKVTVLDGVHIGNRAKIKTHSLVNCNIPANSTVSGAPASFV